MEVEHIPKTVIVTLFGLFEFLCVLFGWQNVAQTFQRFIDRVLQNLPFACAYIDDMLIASQNEQEHISHVRQVFEHFQQYGVVINPLKYIFGCPEVTFLGYHISAEGISSSADKIKSIQDFPVSNTMRQLQAFLGLVHFYCRFLPNCAHVLLPLTIYALVN